MATVGSKVVLFGGNIASVDQNDTWVFEGSSWTQVMTANAPTPRASAAMAALGDEIVLFGGQDQSSTALSDTWIFDGLNWTPSSATGPDARYGAAMASLP